MRETLNTTDYDYLDIIEEVIDRIDDIKDDEDYDGINQAIDDSLIYYNQQWTILKHFFNPQDVNFGEAMEYFTEDVYTTLNALRKEQQ